MSEHRVIPIDEAAAMMGCEQREIIGLIREGKLRSYHMFRRHMVSLSDVEGFIAGETAKAEEKLALRIERRETGGYVYFAASGVWRVKIGFSVDPEARIRALQTAASSRLRLLAVTPGTPKDERAFHKRFKQYRVQNEWFRYSGELRAFVEALADG